jgi:hypothetical protein
VKEPRTRADEARGVINDLSMEHPITEGLFSSAGMLVVDASLSGDRETLEILAAGIRGLYGRRARVSRREYRYHQDTGRLHGLLDAAQSGLQKVPEQASARDVQTLPLPGGDQP